MSAGKRPTVDAAVGVAEALTTVLAALGVIELCTAELGMAALGVAALGVAAQVIVDVVNMTNAKAKPGADRNSLSQVIRPDWCLRWASGLSGREMCLFIFMSIRSRSHQSGLPIGPDGLTVDGVIVPATGAIVGTAVAMGEAGMPTAGAAGIAGRATGKLS